MNTINAQTLGILIVIPTVGVSEQPIIQTFQECEKCGRRSRDEFCSRCGGKIIQITGPLKDYKGNVEKQEVPIPDIRNEMKKLGVERYTPFDENEDDYLADGWIFIVKRYKSFDEPGDFVRLSELNLQQIQNDLNETKEKFKDIITKYNGKVVFGIAGEFFDW